MVEIFGFLVGAIGIVLAVRGDVRMRRYKSMFEEKCQIRCRDLVEAVEGLASPVAEACRIKDESFDTLMSGSCDPQEVVRPIRQMSDQIHAIHTRKNQLVRFCERLNDEHLKEFGELVVPNLHARFKEYG